MKPVKGHEVETAYGCLGYSCLWIIKGQVERRTFFYIRNGEGWSQACLILPAAEAMKAMGF